MNTQVLEVEPITPNLVYGKEDTIWSQEKLIAFPERKLGLGQTFYMVEALEDSYK